MSRYIREIKALPVQEVPSRLKDLADEWVGLTVGLFTKATQVSSLYSVYVQFMCAESNSWNWNLAYLIPNFLSQRGPSVYPFVYHVHSSTSKKGIP